MPIEKRQGVSATPVVENHQPKLDETLKLIIIELARQRAWKDHLASLKPGRFKKRRLNPRPVGRV